MYGGLGGDFASTVLSGSMLAAIPMAFLAGLVSFASPCVVPLVPGYLGLVSGMAGAGAGAGADEGRRVRPRLVWGTLLFIAGFATVFVGLTVVATSAAASLTPHLGVILRVLGVVVIVLGLAFLGWVPFLTAERRFHPKPRTGLLGAPLLGVTFGLGWTPCIGPTLAAVIALALNEVTVWRGAILAVVYSLGLGLPFLALALSLERSDRVLGWLRRHRLALMRGGGALLVALGLLLVTGLWQAWTSSLQSWIQGIGLAL